MLQPDFITGTVWEAPWAIGIAAVFVLAAWLVELGMHYAQRRLERAKSRVLLQLVQSLSRPVFVLIVVEGLLLALSSLSFRVVVIWRPYLAKASVAAAIIIGTYAVARFAGALIEWYMRSRGVRRRVAVDPGLVRFLRRVAVIVIYVVGVLIALDYLGISITPIVAGLGIGGLAVALALQPLLGNFFASTQIVSDRVVRVGDYIELDSGTRGYVTDVGWRSTRIRTPYNNMVIIPNSRLADSIITNYHGPSMAVGVIVSVGVSYSSDLIRVESVAREVAKEVVEELDEAVKEFEPWFAYEEFGESNINFWVWVQANDRVASFRVTSELIKRLHGRFAEEGITINYPVRHLTYDTPDAIPPPLRPRDKSSGRAGEKG